MSAVASSEFTDIACILLPEMTVMYAQVSPQGDTYLQVYAFYKIGLKILTYHHYNWIHSLRLYNICFCDMERKVKTQNLYNLKEAFISI